MFGEGINWHSRPVHAVHALTWRALQVGCIGASKGQRVDVFNDLGGRAICAPEFVADQTVIGAEVEPVSESSEVVWVGATGPAVGGVDVLDDLGGRAVCSPEFVADRSIVSGKVEPVSEGGKVIRIGAVVPRSNIRDAARGRYVCACT